MTPYVSLPRRSAACTKSGTLKQFWLHFFVYTGSTWATQFGRSFIFSSCLVPRRAEESAAPLGNGGRFGKIKFWERETPGGSEASLGPSRKGTAVQPTRIIGAWQTLA